MLLLTNAVINARETKHILRKHTRVKPDVVVHNFLKKNYNKNLKMILNCKY